ncbi:hypothetical protein STEG23_038065 [Scotinomys teguina]
MAGLWKVFYYIKQMDHGEAMRDCDLRAVPVRESTGWGQALKVKLIPNNQWYHQTPQDSIKTQKGLGSESFWTTNWWELKKDDVTRESVIPKREQQPGGVCRKRCPWMCQLVEIMLVRGLPLQASKQTEPSHRSQYRNADQRDRPGTQTDPKYTPECNHRTE